MRFHCLGVGSIGSLLATNLAQLPSTQVRLILRRKDLAKQLLNASATAPDPTGVPYGTLTVERDGLKRRTSGLEMELTKSPNDFFERSSHTTSGGGGGNGSTSRGSGAAPRIEPRVWNRQDPIQTLVVTTKTPATVPAIRHLLPRLSSRSTIVLCQNGMGVLEALLEKYWPEDRSDEIERAYAASAADGGGSSGREGWWGQQSAAGGGGGGGGRPSFVCATTTHGAWRKGAAHFVHAGMGDLKFGVVPNRAVMSFLSSYPDPAWSSDQENPILNPRSLVEPTLEEHLPYAPVTSSLYSTVSSLLQLKELHPVWLPLPTLQIAQLQKLAVNASVNSITAIAGVHNGALVGSQKAKRVIESVTRECADVFAAHVAYEQGLWRPDSLSPEDDTASSSSPRPPPPPPPALPISHPLSSHSLLDYTLRVLMRTSVNISSTLSDLLPLQSNLPPTRSTFSLAQNAPSLPSRTEIEYINGYVVALGRRYGIRTDTVETLGELVLLKEEMARVGAVDRVWQSRGGTAVAATSARAVSPSPSAAPSTPGDESASPTQTRRRRAVSEPLNSTPPAPSSTTTRGSGSSSSSPVSPSMASSSPPPPQSSEHPYDRAARHIQLTRESEARARQREYERIARDRDDRAASANG